MIWAQLIWAAVLAGVLGYTFHRAWRWEHGSDSYQIFGETRGKETFVLVPPTVLFWVLLIPFILFVLFLGLRDGVIRFAALMLDVLLILSVYFVLLLLLLPLFRRWFSARACAVLWLVPAFLSWQGHALISTLPLPRLTVPIPRQTLPVIGVVWLAGFLLVGGYYLVSHLIFCVRVHRQTAPETDTEILALWEREREALDYQRPVRLLRGDVPAPFSMGRTRWSRCTVLPCRAYEPQELSLIFCHELHHLQRCDVDTKVFLCLCNALGWFNPLIWIATRKAAEDLERSCDEIVTEGMEPEARRAYARLLLDAAAPIPGCTTCLSAAAGTLRYRLKGVMEQNRRRLGTLLLMAALFSCVMCFGTVSVTDAQGSFTDLVLGPDTEIRAAYDMQFSPDADWDLVSLRRALDGVELEHIAGLRGPFTGDRQITLLLSDGRYASLSDRALVIRELGRAGGIADCYLVKGGLDWEALHTGLED